MRLTLAGARGAGRPPSMRRGTQVCADGPLGGRRPSPSDPGGTAAVGVAAGDRP